jgi:hypothetical protein
VSCKDCRVVCEGAEDCCVGLWDICLYIVYNNGPRMLPWGTPESIGNGGEVSLLYVVTKYLFCNYDFRRLNYTGGGFV